MGTCSALFQSAGTNQLDLRSLKCQRRYPIAHEVFFRDRRGESPCPKPRVATVGGVRPRHIIVHLSN